MSVESDTTTASAEAEAAAAAAANPALLGLPVFIVGAIALGLFLLGYSEAGLGSLAAMMAIVVVTSGLGLLVASIWAARLGAGPVAAIFGIFAGFWFSLAALVFGLTHEWFGVKVELLFKALATFALCWLILIVVLTLVTLRLPLVFTLLFVLVDVALLFVLLGALADKPAPGSSMFTIAGVAVFAFTAVGVYIFFDAMSVALGGRPMPMGGAVMK